MIDFQNASYLKLSPVDLSEVAGQIAPLLVEGEQTVVAFKGMRDYIAFTTKRIIAVNVQGITGKKKDFTSLPYSNLDRVSARYEAQAVTSWLANLSLTAHYQKTDRLLQNLLPGKVLWLLATGTGLAPFLSLIKDPETYERFEKVVIVHGCRTQAELAYRQLFEHELHEHEYLGEYVRNQLLYYPTVTRERFRNEGRITELMASGKLHSDLGLDAPTVENDRYMICGSPAMLRDLKNMLEERGFNEGNMQTASHFVVERAFAER